MADYPCDVHLARYQGESNRAYLNVYRGEEVAKLKLSVCGDCLAMLVTDWMHRALYETPGGSWDPCSDDTELEGLWHDAGARSGPLNGYRRR